MQRIITAFLAVLLVVGSAFADEQFLAIKHAKSVNIQPATAEIGAASYVIVSVTAINQVKADFAALQRTVDALTVELQKAKKDREKFVYDLLVAIVRNDLAKIRKILQNEIMKGNL